MDQATSQYSVGGRETLEGSSSLSADIATGKRVILTPQCYGVQPALGQSVVDFDPAIITPGLSDALKRKTPTSCRGFEYACG
jgi:hypothetical protein